jgi:hypothetical protein
VIVLYSLVQALTPGGSVLRKASWTFGRGILMEVEGGLGLVWEERELKDRREVSVSGRNYSWSGVMPKLQK